MKKLPFLLILFLGLHLFGTGCQKEKSQPTEADKDFIFGTAAGFCAGNCVYLYKISDGKLFADLMDQGFPAEATFSDTPLNDADYQLALPVKEQFPQALFDEENIIGCPDCHDQGTFFIQVEKEGEVFQWSIDTNPNSLPEYLRPYAKLIGDVVADLRE